MTARCGRKTITKNNCEMNLLPPVTITPSSFTAIALIMVFCCELFQEERQHIKNQYMLSSNETLCFKGTRDAKEWVMIMNDI